MKNRLHDKKAGIFILVSLILISVAEIVYRAVAVREIIYTTANLGEQLVVIGLGLSILILTAMKKDRVCYILYGVWISYFILDQLFEMPSVIIGFYRTTSQLGTIIYLGSVVHTVKILSMCGIVALGALLLEYMNDGSIYNKAFNVICIITVLLILVSISLSCFFAVTLDFKELLLETFYNLYRIAMVFLFAFFAYDSAKKQLLKVDFSK